VLGQLQPGAITTGAAFSAVGVVSCAIAEQLSPIFALEKHRREVRAALLAVGSLREANERLLTGKDADANGALRNICRGLMAQSLHRGLWRPLYQLSERKLRLD
jgi:hypothetical protein